MLGGILYLGHKDEERPSRSTQVEITFGDQVLYFIGLRLLLAFPDSQRDGKCA